VKIAVTSSSFAGALRRGDLTHLEWLEACASRLDVDGVVFALTDFPRTDREYTAQVKKAATDLGLVPVALDVPGLLDPDRPPADRAEALKIATALGCLMLRVTAGPAGELPPETFARTVASTKAFTSLAKAANITLAVAADPATLLGDIGAVQNFAKYVDSAWLRYDVALNDPERGTLGPRDRVLIERLEFDAAPAALSAGDRRPWLLLEGDGGADPLARAGASLSAIRRD
jgi:hypothetical protein